MVEQQKKHFFPSYKNTGLEQKHSIKRPWEGQSSEEEFGYLQERQGSRSRDY